MAVFSLRLGALLLAGGLVAGCSDSVKAGPGGKPHRAPAGRRAAQGMLLG